MFKKILSVALLIFALCACKKTSVDETVPVESVSLNQTEAEMLVGETLQLQAQISPSNATDKTLMWGSSKQSVATVSDAGLVTAVAEGSSKITVTASGKTATCTVTVTKPDGPVDPVESVHVESISLDREDAQLEVGGTLTLTATVLPDNADDKSVTWQSTNPEIAEVDQNGNVTAVSSGTVTITATTTDGGKVAGCEVTVTTAEPPAPEDEYNGEENGHSWVDLGLPSGIKWATCNVGADGSEDLGSQFEWGETFARQDENNPGYTWYDYVNNSILKYLTDSRYYGNLDYLITLEIEDDAAHAQWGGNWRMPTEDDVNELLENTTSELVQQEGVSGVKFTSKNNSQSIFLPNGTYFTSSLDAEYTTYARGLYFDDEFIGTDGVSRSTMHPVRAVIGTASYVSVRAVIFETYLMKVPVGAQRSLKVMVLPENANNKAVTWSSTDPRVAVVDDMGNMTAVGTGYAYIIATADGKEGYLYVSVFEPLDTISITPEDLTLDLGETASITVSYVPDDVLRNYENGYSISNPDIIEITSITDLYGSTRFNIVAKAGGVATFDLYVNVEGDPINLTCRVTVPFEEDEYDGETDGHKWVDLGLPSGIKWALCNVGADNSTQVGTRFLWGENENDPVKANWGGSWSMPSLAAVQELRENTNYEWTKRNGVWGGKLTSKINGKSIFLPAEDYDAGIYFTSSMDKYDVVCINFFDGSLGITYVTPDVMHPVRAVIGDMPYVPVESVDFGYTSSFLEVGQIDYLHVDILPQNATNKKLTWSSSDENVVSVDSRGYVTAVGVGSAIITAEADGKKDEIIVDVEPHYTIYIEPGSLNLKVGQSETITVTLSPELPPKYCGVTTTGSCFHTELISDTYPYTYRITGLTEGVGELSFYTSPLTRATCTITVTNN